MSEQQGLPKNSLIPLVITESGPSVYCARLGRNQPIFDVFKPGFFADHPGLQEGDIIFATGHWGGTILQMIDLGDGKLVGCRFG